ncbi:MAG: dihydrofolate reductase, partial [Cyanobacteria bacterium J06639_1]
DRAIGWRGTLPWSLPEDLARFKRLTYGHAVIVGRKTWQIDLQRRGLPGRQTLVLSTSLSETKVDLDDGAVVTSLSQALAAVRGDRAFIIGGASVYAQTLGMADRLELTVVDGEYPGDTFFPEYEAIAARDFVLQSRESWPEFECLSYRRRGDREAISLPETGVYDR